MLVSVIIPCWNNVADTRACLQSLGQMTGAIPTEILVVDNGSTDQTRLLDREFPSVRILRQERNLGFAGGVNQGLLAARGEWLLVLNNDTLASPGLLSRLLRPLLDDARIGMTAPVSNFVKGEAMLPVGQAGATAAGRADLERQLTDLAGGVLQDVSTLAGLCLLIRRSLLDEIGDLDPRYGIGNFEDDDLCLRARLAGTRLVIVRDAFLHHHGHRTFEALKVDYQTVIKERSSLHQEKWQADPAGRAVLAAALGVLDDTAAAEGLSRYRDWPDGHWFCAQKAALVGSMQVARTHLETFLSRCPHHSEAWMLWALDRLEQRDDTSIDRTFGFLSSRLWFTGDQSARLLLSRAQRSVQRSLFDAARQDLLSASEQAPDNPEIWNKAGALWFELGDVAAAERAFQEALRRGSPVALNNLATSQFRSGRPHEALALWQQALLARPDDLSLVQNVKTALATLQR